MTVYEAVKNRRTVRKFKQDEVKKEDILKLIDSARLAPYGANLQPLKFSVIVSEDLRRQMFPLIKYAGYLPDWDPTFEQSPPVFIAILNDTTIKPTEKSECDSGAAVMSKSLVAEELGLGTCWLGSVDRLKIKEMLNLPEHLDITYLLGVGYPDQKGTAVEMGDSIKYYHDKDENLYVPKRSIKEILV